MSHHVGFEEEGCFIYAAAAEYRPRNPAVLLIIGAAAQATLWPMELIEPLVNEGYHVIRFDNRDIGRSTWISDYAANPYTLEDMAADAIGPLDALNIERAYVIGGSMGGMIVQLVAIRYPQWVLSLTSWMSTYDFNDPDIPAGVLDSMSRSPTERNAAGMPGSAAAVEAS